MRGRLAWSAAAIAVIAGVTVAFPATPLRAPVFGPAMKLPTSAGSTEPRVSVGPDDRRWLVTNDVNGTATVFVSDDKGGFWRRTSTDPSGQTNPTIDVDVVTLPTGRIVATELDFTGINFPTAYSDNGGLTWTPSVGTTLVDMDRQWLAVGPKDSLTGQPVVHLLYHNLGSGFASHNMWVMTSRDGGATFGPPNPITRPGDQAWADLQCADSGGPSSLSVNPKTGQLYAVFGTRSSPAGGCGGQPVEVNIVAATRVWVATSPDNAPGSWTQSLAVDNSQSGRIVGMQLAPGTLDNKGNMWVVYPESPRPYPDYSGAAIRVKHAPPDLSKWSEPVTIVPGGGAGNVVPHILAGDPGKISVAYYHGVARPGKDPVWYTHVAQTLNALDAHPIVTDQRLSNVPAYTWTASEMMGACSADGPIVGVENGFGCDRSTDVWGVALDGSCRATVTWPNRKADAPGSDPGTWVATQTGGAGLCGPAPAASKPASVKPKAKPKPQSKVLGTKTELPATGVGVPESAPIMLLGAATLAALLGRRRAGAVAASPIGRTAAKR